MDAMQSYFDGMTRTRIALILGCMFVGALVFHAQTPAPQTAYRFQQIVPGVYAAIGSGRVNAGSNSAVIVNRDDVVIVDAHMTPEAARVMMEELKFITDKPVRYLIDTHFHYDHTNGNQVFTAPVEIIGHPYTRRRLTGDILDKGMFADLLRALPRQIADLRTRAAAEQDATAKTRLEQQLRSQESFAEQVKETKPTPPTIVVDDRMTLYRGDREIRLLYLGRGHTAGDLVVYLPKERVLCSGDLLVNGVANLIDGFVNEWPDTLEKLKPIDFVHVIPGHGEPFDGKERIDWFQAYLRDLWTQANALHEQKLSAADAATRADMTAHKPHYATINGPGIDARWMSRLYDVIEHRAN
jgi:cyclase